MTRTQTGTRIGGFTLIELMVVVLAASILLAIAIPTYTTEIRKSRRTEAKTAVLDLAAREEKYLSLNNSYTNVPANLGYVAASSTAAFPQPTTNGYYNLYVCVAAVAPGNTGTMSSSAVACPGAAATTGVPSYVVTAIPVAGTSQASDGLCQYFAVDNTGAQFSSSTEGIGTNTVSTCWQ